MTSPDPRRRAGTVLGIAEETAPLFQRTLAESATVTVPTLLFNIFKILEIITHHRIAAEDTGEEESPENPCQCLCAVHKDTAPAVCSGFADTYRHINAPTIGGHDVPLCNPCAAAWPCPSTTPHRQGEP